MKLSLNEFDALVKEWIEIFDNFSKDEFYGTHRDMAEDVFNTLREDLFVNEIAKQNRYKQYLELKAEFENDPL